MYAEKSREGTPVSQLSRMYFRGKRTAGVILREVSKTEERWGFGHKSG